MKLELHVIQSFGPSCLNRDATNSPKDCEFGGVRRARISSQCFKRAMRGYFRSNNLVPVGERTKRLRAELMPMLDDLQPADSLEHGVDAFLDTYYSKTDGKNYKQSAVLLFVSQVEMQTIADCVRQSWKQDAKDPDSKDQNLQSIAQSRAKKVAELEARAATRRRPAAAPADGAPDGQAADDSSSGKFENLPKPKLDKDIAARLDNAALSSDIALFGRMLAEHTDLKVEAASQVAHAISTHAVNPDLDFFAAVDDLNTDDAGAGMLGVTGFNAACFYRYALVDLELLAENLDDRATALETTRAFMKAFVCALPTGKQNSMAAQSPPSFGMFVVRESGSLCSLANAFCKPVRVRKDGGEDDGLVEKSVVALTNYWKLFIEAYGSEGIKATPLFCIEGADKLGVLAPNKTSLNEAIDQAMQALSSGAQDEEAQDKNGGTS